MLTCCSFFSPSHIDPNMTEQRLRSCSVQTGFGLRGTGREKTTVTVSSLLSIYFNPNEWHIHQSFCSRTTTHTHTRKQLTARPSLAVICLQMLFSSIHLSAPPAAGQLSAASPQLIKMPAEFTSGGPGCKFLPRSVGLTGRHRAPHHSEGKMDEVKWSKWGLWKCYYPG